MVTNMEAPNFVRHVLPIIMVILALTSCAAEVRQPIVAGNLEIFYGVMPAEVLFAYPPDHAERTMHGGVPGMRSNYHLVVSLFDTKKRVRISDALVRARISAAGRTPQTSLLQPMQISGVVTYGNYFALTAPGPFRITLDITQSHGGAPVQVSFEHRHR